MARKKLLLIGILFIAYSSFGQNFEWAKQFSGPSTNNGESITTDPAGNIYTAGFFTGIVDFDPGPGVFNLSQPGGAGAYISKLSTTGDLIWAKHLAGWNILVYSITLDASGNIYTTGFFQQTADFDPGPGVSMLDAGLGPDAFISKLDVNGNFLWVKRIEGLTNRGIIAYQVVIDGSGNVLISGGFEDPADFDPGPSNFTLTNGTTSDAFVLKLDSGGNFVWACQFSGSNYMESRALALDASGSIYVLGYFSGVADFDPGPGQVNVTANPVGPDNFVCKLDAAGNFVWVKSFGGSWQTIPISIDINNSGHAIITGGFRDMIDADPGPGVLHFTSVGDVDAYLITLDQMGNLVWAKQFGGTGQDRIQEVRADALGSLTITGDFQNVVDFEPGTGITNLVSAGGSDVFVAQLNNLGNLVWARQVGGPGDDLGLAAAKDFAGNILATGFFNLVADFDPGTGLYNMTSGGSDNSFILKLSHCIGLTTSVLDITACFSYTLNNQTYNSTGTYVQTLINSAGCDSIITLNLVIGGYNNTTSVTACDSYFWEGQTYLVSGSYMVSYTAQDGCDSTLNLNLIIKNSASTTSSVAICEGGSYEGYTASGTYTDIFTASNGCDSTRTLHLTVNPVAFSTINAVICEGDFYEGYHTTGTYTDTYTGMNGCDSTRTLNLIVNPRKNTSITAAICEGESFSAGGGLQTISGIYRDTLISAAGCDSIITTTLTVHQKPNPSLGPDTGICVGAVISFDPGSFSNYTWQDNSTNQIFSTSTTGLYWVTVTDENNCTATDSVRITRIDPLPEGFLKSSDSICAYDRLVLQPNQNFVSYLWSTGSASNNISIGAAGEYWLMVTDHRGCIGKDTIKVFHKPCNTGVFFPSAFTPNKDNLNDIFKPVVRGKLVSFRMEIYDRGGEPVFKTTNADIGWDGSIRGIPMGSAVLVWQCFYQLEGGPPAYAKGIVTIIR